MDINDDVSSLTNATGNWVVFFRDVGYTDKAICVAPGATDWRLGDHLFNSFCGSPCGTMDNRLSSHRIYASEPPGGLCTWTVR